MGQLCFPLCRPRVPGAHVCRVFVATSLKVAELPDRLRRCEPPPSQSSFSRPTCSRGRLAQLFFLHAALPRLAPVTTKQLFISRDRGPRPQTAALRASAFKVGMRWDGGGSHRLAGPGREQLSSRKRVFAKNVRPRTRQLTSPRRRLDTGPPYCWSIQEITLGANQAGRNERRCARNDVGRGVNVLPYRRRHRVYC